MTPQDPLHKLLSTGDAAGARVLLAEEDLSVKYSRDSLLAALMWASEHGETQCVFNILAACSASPGLDADGASLIPARARDRDDYSPSIAEALRLAALNGFEASVKLLAAAGPHVDDISYALMEAAKNGHLSCVEALIPLCDPAACDAQALVWAALGGHLACVERLLQVSTSCSGICQALVEASGNGHVECVNLLLPRCDPSADNSLALRWAIWEGQAEIVDILLPHSDPLAVGDNGHDAMATAINDGHANIVTLIEFFFAKQERDAILDTLDTPAATSSTPRL